MSIERVCIIGGTGFVGKHLVAKLTKKNVCCRILTRRQTSHRDMKLFPGVELQEVIRLDKDTLTQSFKDCDAVINLAGVLHSGKDNNSFEAVHIHLVENIVDACEQAGIHRLLHMSALNANPDITDCHYLHTKGIGEQVALNTSEALCTTAFRPSVIFGRDDSFINRFRQLLRIPGPMPLACPDAIMSPVHVDDVVSAFLHVLDDSDSCGKQYDLCGPEQLTLQQIIRLIAQSSGKQKVILPLPDWLSRLQAGVLEHVPGKPFTRDNYHALQYPGKCQHDGLTALGITAYPMSQYLEQKTR